MPTAPSPRPGQPSGHLPRTVPRPNLARVVVGRLRGVVSHAVASRRHHDRAALTNPADAALRDLLHRTASEISQQLGDPRAGAMFERQMLNTWQTTIRPLDAGHAFVITGDLPAMWLRDSSAQLRPFLMLVPQSEQVRDTIAAVIAEQWRLVGIDPYANAFNATPSSITWNLTDLPMLPRVWERKYEIDSLAFPVQLAWQFWRITGSTEHLTDEVHEGMSLVVDLWQREQHHETQSDYRFLRPGSGHSLPRGGRGAPVRECGLTWSGFRPSDDPCELGYNIPGNLFAAHALELIAEIADSVFGDAGMAGRARALSAEITAAVRQVGTVSVGAEMGSGVGTEAGGAVDAGQPSGRDEAREGGVPARTIWAYEVDGLGGVLVGDDANMPSLLSLPLTGGIAVDDPLYLSTREAVLSPLNPWWHSGRSAHGIGSPHTPGPRVWPIALAVQALTTRDRTEQLDLLRMLIATDAGTGLMHESFLVDDPGDYTRPWFSWANSMFCELLLTLSRGSLTDLLEVGPH